MKAYIASPFFNTKQRMDVKRMEDTCQKAEWESYSPRLGVISTYYNDERDKVTSDMNDLDLYKRMTFAEDIIEINKSDVVMINYDGKDSGTLFELGYAHYKNKMIINAATDLNTRVEFEEIYENFKRYLHESEVRGSIYIDDGTLINFTGGRIVAKKLDPAFTKSNIIIAEHGGGDYCGYSKIMAGLLYAQSKLPIIYVDVPRKSNLMLTNSLKVYECDDLSLFDDIDQTQFNSCEFILNTKCRLVRNSKDE